MAAAIQGNRLELAKVVGDELGGGAEPEKLKGDVLSAANIKEAKLISKRASPRLAKNVNTDLMSKAKKRTYFGAGNTSNLSFIQFPSVDISSHLSDIGVSLGSDPSSVSESISLLKNVEHSRLKPLPSSTEVCDTSEFLAEDDDNDLENDTLGHLCGELLEEFVDMDIDHLSSDFKTVFKKNKSSSLTRSKKKPKVQVVRKHKSVSP